MKRVLCALVLLTGLAHAEPPTKLMVFNSVYGRINPLGIEDWLMVGLQRPLYEARNPAVRDNWIYYGVLMKTSPSSLKIGPHLEMQPLSILQLRLTTELTRFFGVFTTFQSFDSPLADYSDSALYKLADTKYPTTALHIGFSPTLQVAIGPIVIRDTPSFDYWNAQLRPGDTVFYDTNSDTLMAPNTIVISNDADVLWRIPKYRLFVGIRHTLVQPFYPLSAYQPGEKPDNPNGHNRLTAVGVWTFYYRPNGKVRSLTAALIFGWYLQHRWRTGADVNPGVPYGLLGFVIETDYVR
jgi:hypothetical protein